MMRSARQVSALTVVAALLASCAGQPPAPEPTIVAPVDTAVDQFVADRRVAAKRLEAAGDLAEALVDWRLVAAVRPRDSEAEREIDRLDSLIDRRKAGYLKQADDALGRGRQDEARTLYLKVLALDGSDAQALRHLRDIERRTVLANQKKKDEKALAEYRASHAKPIPDAAPADESFDTRAAAAFKKGNYRQVIDLADQQLKRNSEDSAAAGYRQRAYMALAQESRKKGNLRDALTYLEAASETPAGEQAVIEKAITTAKTDIADQLYSEGLDHMNSDLDRAIELLTEALNYDPRHLAARQRLDQAQRMRARLQSIK